MTGLEPADLATPSRALSQLSYIPLRNDAHPWRVHIPVIYNRKDPNGVPVHAKYVGRPTIWGNLYSHLPGKGEIQVSSRDEAVDKYAEWLQDNDRGLYELRGKDLTCWCVPERCHAEILDAEANRGTLIAVTGHRPANLGHDGYNPKAPVRLKIREWLAKQGAQHEQPMWITGGALGVDQDAAREAHKNGQPYMVAIPFRGQQNKWRSGDQQRYRKMIELGDSRLARRLAWKDEQIFDGAVVIHEGPYPGPWVLQKRNEWMVDRCDLLLGVWNGDDGGTANCLAYAAKIDRRTIWVDPTDL